MCVSMLQINYYELCSHILFIVLVLAYERSSHL